MNIFVERSHIGITHIELLGGERPSTNARRVRFDDPNDLSDAARRNAEAGADSADARRTARHVRIRAIVDVEHQRVRAFNEDALARHERLVYIHDAVNDERAQPFRQSLWIRVLKKGGVTSDREKVRARPRAEEALEHRTL